jgi:hypothetical protein
MGKMPRIVATIFTTEHLGKKNTAETFFLILQKNHLALQKIGLFEPLKIEYSIEKAIEFCVIEENGCYIEGKGYTGKSGGIIGKGKDPTFQVNLHWWNSPVKVYTNYIDFYFPLKTFKKYQKEIETVFQETVSLLNGIYGYITHEIPENRQHITGTIETRIPGVFWCNYFSEKYIQLIGGEKLFSFPWYQVEFLGNGGILAYLSADPESELVLSDELEVRAKSHLGPRFFGIN